MIRNYLKIAFRNISRHKMLSGINILGLAVGISCCMLIALYIFHETSYDRFHTNADRIVRVTMEYALDGNTTNVSVTGNKAYPAFKRTFPEVESGVRIYPAETIVKLDEKLFNEKGLLYADPTFFNLFSFKLVQGDPNNVLMNPNQVVLTHSVAQKYFGNENPVGKTIRINDQKDLVVTGVAADCPSNSQIKFDLVVSFSSLEDDRYTAERWWDASYCTYLLLKRPADIKSLQAKIPAYMKTQAEENGLTGSNYMTFHLQPIKDVHLYAEVEGGLEPGSDYRYMYIFGAIALLILSIAFANYLNLTTARAAERAREVGVRKVMGALRKQLFGQFMGESVLTVTMALLISLLLLRLLLPAFNSLADRQFLFSSILQPAPLLVLLAILLIVGFLGGIYPALVLSRFHPIKVLKGNFKTGASGVWLRKSLIIVQFAIGVSLVVCTLIINSQLNYIQNKKLGYNKDYILEIPTDKIIQDKIQAVKATLLSNPGITHISAVNQTPAFIASKYFLRLNDRDMIVSGIRTDKDFIQTMNIRLLHGTDFSTTDQQLSDSPNIQRPVIINESAARLLGWTSESAIGKPLQFQGKNSIVKAVVQDFHFSSMHNAISPLVIFISGNKNKLLVKLTGEHLSQTLEYIKAKWSILAPHRPFEYEFLDAEFDRLYSAETRTGRLFYSFAILAIGLACLGLLGLSTYTTRQRAKEISIRKVLGATVPAVILLLSKDFLKLVIIAALLAFPVAWFATHQWLQSFVYRVHIRAWVYIAAISMALVIVLGTISLQVIKTALTNPAKSLRSE